MNPVGRVCAAFVVRDNLRHRRDIENAYLQAIRQAKFEIILANAYFFPGFNSVTHFWMQPHAVSG